MSRTIGWLSMRLNRTTVITLFAVAAATALLLPVSANAAAFTVTKLDDPATAGPCAPGDCSLRDAIAEANGTPGSHLITFAGEAASGTINLQSALPPLTGSPDGWEIRGPGADQVTVRRDDGAPDFRIFEIESAATAEISGLTISGGSSDFGGGIHNRGKLALQGSTVSENEASECCGGIASAGGTLTVRDSIVSANTAGTSGGGILGQGNNRETTVVNSTVSGNTGGGIVIIGDGHMLTLANSTIARNEGGSNLRISSFNIPGGEPATAMIRSTILADPADPSVNCSAQNATLTSEGYNLASDGSCELDQPTDQPDTAPLLGPLADNGGPTETHALGSGSPAIDKGIANELSTDQRGLPRPSVFPEIPNAPGGDGTDIGAFEVQAPPSPPDGEPRNLPAKLRIVRAQIRGNRPNRRLIVGGSIDRAAAGEQVVIRYRARKRWIRFRTNLGQFGHFGVKRRLRGPQRRPRGGRVVVRYRGNAELRPTTERLRAAPRPVRLRLNRGMPRLRGPRLIVAGRAKRRARGRVTVRIEYNRPGGAPAEITVRRKLNRRGRFRIRRNVPPAVRNRGAHVSVTHRGRGRLHGQRIGAGVGP